MNRWITCFCLILIIAAIAWGTPYAHKPVTGFLPDGTDADSSHNWDAIHYEIQFQLDPISVPNEILLDGEVMITFEPEVSGLDTLDLHFHGDYMQVDAVQLEGQNCDFYRDDDMLYVIFPSPQNPGDTLDLYIDYGGFPEITNLITPTGIFYASTNMIYTMNDPFGARNWIPCWDEPWDKATVRLRMWFPEDFTVAANGNLEVTIAAPPYRYWQYYMNHPITTYLISFCASDYATIIQTSGSVLITHYVYPAHLAAAQADFANVPEMIQVLSDRWGPYPFDSYGYAEAPIFSSYGAMEHQTLVTYGNGLITGTGGYEDIVVHELGHMWFGDAVSYIDWPEMWLSEGFAEYTEAIWFEHLNGPNAYFSNMLQKQQTYYGWENPSNPRPMYDPGWSEIWSAVTYQKGACVLSMLRYHLGDDDFFAMMQNYFNTYKYGNASTPDLRAEVEAISGEDYGWFFDQWVYQGGYPTFQYFGSWVDASDQWEVYLSVAQEQPEAFPLFKTDIDVYVFSGPDTTIERITLEAEDTQVVQFLVDDEPDSVQLDPRSWILGYKQRRDDLTEPDLSIVDATIDDEGGNGFLDPGETGDLSFVLSNGGLPSPAAEVVITSHDPLLTVVEGTRTIPAIPFSAQYDLSADPFVVENAAASGPRWSDFTVEITDELTGDPIATLDLSLPVGTPEILLVDDDNGGVAEEHHQETLNEIRRVYHTVEYTSAGDLPPLTDYLMVIWACGPELTNTLTTDDQALLEDYLVDGHGSLMLSGRGVVPDLAGTGFFQNVLHAQSAGTTPSMVLSAVHPLLEGLQFSITGQGSNQDVLETDGDPDAAGLLEYLGLSLTASVLYDGDYKSVVFGFGFEDVISGSPVFNEPWEMLAPLVEWSTGTPGVEDRPSAMQPRTFAVGRAYPNPFNAVTTIPFDLPVASRVKLEIFDVNGRLVSGEDSGSPLHAGHHIFTFDASHLASGVYFYRIEAQSLEGEDQSTGIGKMVLLK